MKFNKWTVGLAAVGVVSLASAARADEQMSQVQTALSQTTLSGYVDTAMQWNPATDKSSPNVYPGNVPKYAFAQDDGFQFNAVDIALDKPEDTSQWAAGYHVEMMYGADAVGVPFGAAQPTSGAGPAATIRQAFIRLHTPVFGNGIDWQVGVWDNIIGYESNSDPLNPNYTRSYGYSIEPTTMTGVLGTYKVNDEISVSAGIADVEGGLGSITPAFTPTAAFESQKAYMGDIALTAPDSMGFLKGATMTLAAVNGVDSAGSKGTTTSWYAGATLPTPITQLKVGAAFDYLDEADLNATAAGTHANGDDIWVAGLYATYQATDKLSFNFRGEYVDDDSNPAIPAHGLVAAVPGDVVSLYSYYNPTTFTVHGNSAEELTATVQYNLWANVMTRGEFRWDHVEHADPFGAANQGAGIGTPFRSNDFLLALNIIYQF
ncbi:MAG TPA: outer membrane beta-barrel protein [Candidatus Sulfotelmatobacter sp.]|nr:outer membrane beta-barrel protein [Candidatus Sulfotelmatobacter sp.]